jgi:inner membrane protein
MTHYGITAVTVTVAGWLAGWYLGYSDVGLSFGLGYLSHVALADALTIAGVPLLWPWRKKFHLLPRPLRIRTGGLVEQLIGLVLVCLLVAWLPWLLAAETRIGRPDQ